ncbi:MAG: hypothetical protein J2P15_22175, partial [Micromonosporaceae bacterium]|nr:hypothetical protein [Micromonosporaceae bacterium]
GGGHEGGAGGPVERSGPWAPARVTPGGAVTQTLPGSCVSAAGEMLTHGAVSQADLLAELGEWSNPVALRDALNARGIDGGGWRGGFLTEQDALRVASAGPIAAVLMAPGERSMHMVAIEPAGDGTFTVRDPLPGVTYTVDSAWIREFVAGGVFR